MKPRLWAYGHKVRLRGLGDDPVLARAGGLRGGEVEAYCNTLLQARFMVLQKLARQSGR